MALLVWTGNYGAISKTYPTTTGCYVVEFIPDTVTLQEDNTTYL